MRAVIMLRSACLAMLCLFPLSSARGQLEFESPPINYGEAHSHDAIAKLQQQLDAGKAELAWDDEHGYLKAVLAALDISPSTQMLVFSKTSFQLPRISPKLPRAIYFNDDVYIGWVQNGDVIEVSATDPELGAVFYTLAQRDSEPPKFVRDRGQCLTCHASSRTEGVPGHLIRSVYSSASGMPIFGSGTYRTTQASPFEQRFGGWYVTGTHGVARHMGNVLATEREPEQLDREAGANLTDLSPLVDVEPYLEPHSDLIALMTLTHQAEMHNWITRANFETRLALHSSAIMNEMLDRPADYQSESTQRRIERAAEQLLECMLFVKEEPLAAPLAGTSGFAETFAARGPFDSQGRSLRQFDLKTRLLKFPCSYLIYSEAFLKLPPAVKLRVYTRLDEILTGRSRADSFEKPAAADCAAIREILLETHPELAAAWQPKSE
ncbi:MAG: hypothetical protein KDA42_00550 [Planctomycetales bacterium]|nr:hypothetical protein [Planctomycetales bacterium]